ncbi:MAG TPA: hypothetical protein VFI47_19435, partial [Acidimicrobiales bacterium]|nr:hypothetical protein [Acidimicrobiales bacterium]
EVAELRSREDDLETLVDTLLDLADTVVLVIDDDRRITGLSRAAAARLDGAAVGKPLSSAVSADEFDRLAALLDGDGPPPGAAGDGPVLHRLPHGGAVLVLVDR